MRTPVLCSDLAELEKEGWVLVPANAIVWVGDFVDTHLSYGLDRPDIEAAVRAFALKEAELNGWRVPEDFPEHESFEALIAERMSLWREEVTAAVEAAVAKR